MSFQSPLFLLALLLVPLGVCAYLLVERRHRRAATAFVRAPLAASVAPVRPRWRRHAPMLLYVLAIAALAVALARPETTVAVPEEHASVVLVSDDSGSMEATDVSPSRLAAARQAADGFLDDVPDGLPVGAVLFNHRVRRVAAPTTDRQRVRALLDEQQPAGGTATGDALAAAVRLLDRRDDREGGRVPGAIVLLSDGASTHGRDPIPVAREARRKGIRVYTVSLGTPNGTIEVRTPDGGTEVRSVPPDTETLGRIADIARGHAFATGDRLELDSVYEQLGSRLGTREEQRDVTAGFAGAAALLLGIGGLLSLFWFGRLP